MPPSRPLSGSPPAAVRAGPLEGEHSRPAEPDREPWPPAALRAGPFARRGWPGLCEVCRGWTRGGLCASCTARLAAAAPRCARCALRVATAEATCAGCALDAPPFVRTVCLGDYAYPWSGLVAALKFHDRPELGGPLARALADAATAAGMPLPQVFVPVPLARPRLAARGYNQAVQLARALAHCTGVRLVADALERRFDAANQAALPRAERLANLRGAFAAVPRARPLLHGRHAALVDDVMTTGATARAAAAALLEAGAERVDVWVVARTAD